MIKRSVLESELRRFWVQEVCSCGYARNYIKKMGVNSLSFHRKIAIELL